MAKIGYMNIAGKQYPLSLSLGASRRIAEKYGGIQKISSLARGSDGLDNETVEMLIDVAEILIAQGCAYKNMFEKDLPPEPDAPVDPDGRYVPLTKEEIEVGISLCDLSEFTSALFLCLGKSQEREIETESNQEGKKE